MSVIEHQARIAQPIHASRTPRVTVAQLALRAVNRWRTNRAIRELSQLEDRLLEDIGISRNDIPRLVEGRFGPDELRFGDHAPASTPEERMRLVA